MPSGGKIGAALTHAAARRRRRVAELLMCRFIQAFADARPPKMGGRASRRSVRLDPHSPARSFISKLKALTLRSASE
jgi:hypothetical protein